MEDILRDENAKSRGHVWLPGHTPAATISLGKRRQKATKTASLRFFRFFNLSNGPNTDIQTRLSRWFPMGWCRKIAMSFSQMAKHRIFQVPIRYPLCRNDNFHPLPGAPHPRNWIHWSQPLCVLSCPPPYIMGRSFSGAQAPLLGSPVVTMVSKSQGSWSSIDGPLGSLNHVESDEALKHLIRSSCNRYG